MHRSPFARAVATLAVVCGAVASAVFAAQPAFATAVPWTNCEPPPNHDIFTVTNVDVSPYPPVPGNTVTLTLSGVLAAPVASGTYSESVTFQGIPIYAGSGAVGSYPVGPVTVSQEVQVPQVPLPAGAYEVRLSATTQSPANTEIFCVTFPVQVD